MFMVTRVIFFNKLLSKWVKSNRWIIQKWLDSWLGRVVSFYQNRLSGIKNDLFIFVNMQHRSNFGIIRARKLSKATKNEGKLLLKIFNMPNFCWIFVVFIYYWNCLFKTCMVLPALSWITFEVLHRQQQMFPVSLRFFGPKLG